MNSKRQTVWLVSMLSLMVVLSAYYLFTDRVEEKDVPVASESEQDKELSEDFLIDEVLQQAGWSEESTGLTDEEVLEEYDSQMTMGQDYFTSLQMERMQEYNAEMEELYEVLNESENTEAVAEAMEKVGVLEERQNKLTHIEEKLLDQYENVVVSEQDGKWNVMVIADQIEKSEAVSIIDMVSQEMEVHAGMVQVQFQS